MPKVFTSKTQKTGEIGENIAERFLVKRGFSILERNYTKKWGELDIVAEKEGKLHFVEIKSVSTFFPKSTSAPACNTMRSIAGRQPSSPEREGEISDYRPEENMHPQKLKRISRALQTYLISKKKHQNKEWQVDLLIVYLDLKNKKARIKVVEDIIL